MAKGNIVGIGIVAVSVVGAGRLAIIVRIVKDISA